MARAELVDVTFEQVPVPGENSFSFERNVSIQINDDPTWFDPDCVVIDAPKVNTMRLPSGFASDILRFAKDYTDIRSSYPRRVYTSHSFAEEVGRTAYRIPSYASEKPVAVSQVLSEGIAEAIVRGGRKVRKLKLREWGVIGSGDRAEVMHSIVGLVDGQVIQVDKPSGFLHIGTAEGVLSDYRNLMPDREPALYAFRLMQRFSSAVGPQPELGG